jgi:hypothetical protein
MYYATDKKGFNALLKQANNLLGFPDDKGTDNYCNPIIDMNGAYYFTVNFEVESLVDKSKCVEFETIKLPELKR